MNKQRRLFLNQFSVMAGIVALNKPLTSIAAVSKHIHTLHAAETAVTIYHTDSLNGMTGAGFDDMGGIKQVKTLLSKQETGGLLMDAGNFLNSSRSLAQQREMINIMNNAGYHAAGIGRNELANGQAHLASLVPQMKFKLVNCNYRFDAALASLVNPYIIVNTGKFKVGVTGVGQQVHGVVCNDAIKCANRIARLLKEDEKCDLVICLAHLGDGQHVSVNNQTLAAASENIDMIIGGDGRQVFRSPKVVKNQLKREVVLSQTAWNGLMLGRMVFNFENGKQKQGFKGKYFIVGHPEDRPFETAFTRIRAKQNVA